MWSIGIYAGESPFCLTAPGNITNPIMTRDQVTDARAEFVADPFMLRRQGVWFMFFEVMNRETRKGEIGLATSECGFVWQYQQIVLVEPFHLSYPYVFKWDNEFYMIPETLAPGAIRLYRANPFPSRWTVVGDLFKTPAADPSIFRFQDRWWMFTCSNPFGHDVLRLYFAESLPGPWREHPASPLLEGDKQRARPAGRVLTGGDNVIRFAQDCVNSYGNQVRAFTVSELTPASYAEHEHELGPILKASGDGWNELGMHHVDAHQQTNGSWLACVDGLGKVD
ncbi:MAG TPA: hypothetical protein VLL54_20680 [Pyrinomonadaceae bacterium]|nr:hypothetical protein [Pyrinomonadaceae bacterium]